MSDGLAPSSKASRFSVTACRPAANQASVVVYTSVGQVYAEPVLTHFEQVSGIRVLAVYDAEAAKTSGLVNRLIAEAERPQADVFWNGEFAQTVLLARKRVLAPATPVAASAIPARYKDSEGYWFGVGVRARVLLLNTLAYPVSGGPVSFYDFMDSKTASKDWGMAYPLFGTAPTQAAAMFVLLGDEAATDFYQRVRDRRIRIVDGNSVVRDMVASGELSAGLTDTDDACRAIRQGKPVRVVFPDAGGHSIGTLFVPSTVAMVGRGPHRAQGERLLEYLLSDDVEGQLIDAGLLLTPTHSTPTRQGCLPLDRVRPMDVSYADVADRIEPVARRLREIFAR